MRCESCGRNLPEDAAFCPECGDRSSTRSAAEIVDFAHTSGLVRGRAAGEVPDAAEPPAAAESVPEIPRPAPLPSTREVELPAAERIDREVAIVSGVDRARIRESARRAAQAVVETAQSDLREELAELAEQEARIEAASQDAADLAAEERRTERRGRTVESVYPKPEPPPPPPPSAEERMWEETRERARLHGLGVPVEGTEPEQDQNVQEAMEARGQNCLAYGCITLGILLFLFFVLGFILNAVQ